MRIVAIPAVLAALLVVTACSSGPHAAPGHAGSGAGHTPSPVTMAYFTTNLYFGGSKKVAAATTPETTSSSMQQGG